MLTRKSIIERPTPDSAEVLVVFEENGIPRNVLLSDATLARKLADTPAMVANPDRAPIDEAAFAAAEAQIKAETPVDG